MAVEGWRAGPGDHRQRHLDDGARHDRGRPRGRRAAVWATPRVGQAGRDARRRGRPRPGTEPGLDAEVSSTRGCDEAWADFAPSRVDVSGVADLLALVLAGTRARRRASCRGRLAVGEVWRWLAVARRASGRWVVVLAASRVGAGSRCRRVLGGRLVVLCWRSRPGPARLLPGPRPARRGSVVAHRADDAAASGPACARLAASLGVVLVLALAAGAGLGRSRMPALRLAVLRHRRTSSGRARRRRVDETVVAWWPVDRRLGLTALLRGARGRRAAAPPARRGRPAWRSRTSPRATARRAGTGRGGDRGVRRGRGPPGRGGRRAAHGAGPGRRPRGRRRRQQRRHRRRGAAGRRVRTSCAARPTAGRGPRCGWATGWPASTGPPTSSPPTPTGSTTSRTCRRSLSPVLEGRADFVTGSRRLGRQHDPGPLRRLGVHVFAWLVERADRAAAYRHLVRPAGHAGRGDRDGHAQPAAVPVLRAAPRRRSPTASASSRCPGRCTCAAPGGSKKGAQPRLRTPLRRGRARARGGARGARRRPGTALPRARRAHETVDTGQGEDTLPVPAVCFVSIGSSWSRC